MGAFGVKTMETILIVVTAVIVAVVVGGAMINPPGAGVR
jgi:hypothetical protein